MFGAVQAAPAAAPAPAFMQPVMPVPPFMQQ
jgi:hypothetical protein